MNPDWRTTPAAPLAPPEQVIILEFVLVEASANGAGVKLATAPQLLH